MVPVPLQALVLSPLLAQALSVEATESNAASGARRLVWHGYYNYYKGEKRHI
jgi:hypothetical protein